MTDTRTVYALSSGSYSTYRIHCLFEREEDAKAAAAAAGRGQVYSDHFIEELTLFGPVGQPRKTVMYTARATVRVEGHWKDWAPNVSSEEEWIYTGRGPERPELRRLDRGQYVTFEARGEDREQVTKMVADAYAQAIAEREQVA